jgi:hypothetical protein
MSTTRADAIAALISAELARHRERLNADGDMHGLHVYVQFSDRNGRPFKVRMNMETERMLS